MIRRDFGRAKRRGEWRRILSFVKGRAALLLTFGLVREISCEEAVASWCDNVYGPLVGVFRSEGMLESFPKWTEAGLCVWTSKHVCFLQQRFEDGVSLDAAARAFATRYELPRALRLLERIRDRMRPDGSTRAKQWHE